MNRLQRGEGETLESCVSEKKGRGAGKRRCFKLEFKHVGRNQTLGKKEKIKSISQPSPVFSLNYSLYSATMCIAS